MRFNRYLTLTVAFASIAVMSATRFAQAGTIDAITAASFSMKAGTTTATTATVNCGHNKNNGTYRFYYDVASHTTVSAYPLYAQAKIGVASSITDLKPATTYYFWAQGYDGTAPSGIVAKAKITGTFKTDAAAGISEIRIDAPGRKVGNTVDALGRKTTATNGMNIRFEPSNQPAEVETK